MIISDKKIIEQDWKENQQHKFALHALKECNRAAMRCGRAEGWGNIGKKLKEKIKKIKEE